MSFTLMYHRPEEHAPYSAIESLEVEINDERSLDEMLQAFKQFLQACGYVIDGDIDIIPTDLPYIDDLPEDEEWK